MLGRRHLRGAWTVLVVSGDDRAWHHDDYSVAALPVAAPALMIFAMMSPLVLPTLRRVALTSLWSNPHWMQGVFLVCYVGAWTLLTLALPASTGAAAANFSRDVVVVFVASQPPRGSSRDASVARCSGALGRVLSMQMGGAISAIERVLDVSAATCAVTCWGFMALVTASGHRTEVLALLFARTTPGTNPPLVSAVPERGCSCSRWSVDAGRLTPRAPRDMWTREDRNIRR